MFEHLSKWPRILVVGPQRSGTRIATTMIAHDTGHWAIFEEDNRVQVDSLVRLWHTLETSRRVVIQAPCMTAYCNLLGVADKKLCVVLMRRDLEDIEASEKRIRWGWHMPELIRQGFVDGRAAEIKYQQWDDYQKKDLGIQAYEVEYESLETHGLWIAKPGRLRFGPRQTS